MFLTGVLFLSFSELRAGNFDKYRLSNTLLRDYEPKVDFYFCGGALQANLEKFNLTLPAHAKKMNTTMPALGFGFATINRRFTFNTQLHFALRQRSIFNNYEQIFLGRTHWSVTFGRHLYANKKLNLVITPMLGFAVDAYSMHYHNDSFFKKSSIPWVIRSQNPNQQEMEHLTYTNPSMAAIGHLRITTTHWNRLSVTANISYQQDLGSGYWHYIYGFRRTDSPETRTSGLCVGLSIGVLINASDVNEE